MNQEQMNTLVETTSSEALLPLFPDITTEEDCANSLKVLENQKEGIELTQAAVINTYEGLDFDDPQQLAASSGLSLRKIKDLLIFAKIFSKHARHPNLPMNFNLAIAKAVEGNKIAASEILKVGDKAIKEAWSVSELKRYLKSQGKVLDATGTSTTRTQVRFTYRAMTDSEDLETYVANMDAAYQDWKDKFIDEVKTAQVNVKDEDDADPEELPN